LIKSPSTLEGLDGSSTLAMFPLIGSLGEVVKMDTLNGPGLMA